MWLWQQGATDWRSVDIGRVCGTMRCSGAALADAGGVACHTDARSTRADTVHVCDVPGLVCVLRRDSGGVAAKAYVAFVPLDDSAGAGACEPVEVAVSSTWYAVCAHAGNMLAVESSPTHVLISCRGCVPTGASGGIACHQWMTRVCAW